MARFSASREVAAPAEDVWRLITDWSAHGRWVPATTMTVERDTGGVGTSFTGRSGVGPLVVDDVMEVVRWEPATAVRAGTAGIEHRGSVVRGTAEVQVVPLPGRRCRVRWTEDIEVVPTRLTRPFAPVMALGGRVMFGRVLASVAQEAEDAERRAPAEPTGDAADEPADERPGPTDDPTDEPAGRG